MIEGFDQTVRRSNNMGERYGIRRVKLAYEAPTSRVRQKRPRIGSKIFSPPWRVVLCPVAAILISLIGTSSIFSQPTPKPHVGDATSASCPRGDQIPESVLSQRSEPFAASFNFLRGIEYARKGDYAAAEQQFQTAWVQAPREGEYAKTLVLFYINQKRFEDARRVTNRYKSLCGSNALTYSLEAELLFQQRKYDVAYRKAQASLKLSPANSRMHEILGLILTIRGRYLAALPDLQTAAQQNPANPQIRYFYGRALYSTGRYPEALEEFLACLRLRPAYPRALANVGLCYEALQEFNKAGDAYKEAIKQEQAAPQSKDVEPFTYYGALLAKLGQNTEAMKMLQKALTINPGSFRANYELGKLFLSRGDFQNAEKCLSKALTLDPQFSRTYYLMGRLYDKEHHVQDAARYFAVFQQLNEIPANREFPFTKQ